MDAILETVKAGNAKKGSRWASFSLRFMCLAVTFLCVFLGVLSRFEDRRRTVSDLHSRGSKCHFRGAVRSDNAVQEWARSIFPRPYLDAVTSVHVQDSSSIEADIGLISRLPYVESVIFQKAKIGQASWSRLSRLPSLRRLCFWECELEDNAFSELVQLRRLELIDLSRCVHSEQALTPIIQMEQVHHISINSDSGIDARYLPISKMANLDSLLLSSKSGVSWSFLREALANKSLRTLTIISSPLKAVDQPIDNTRSRMERLSLNRCRVHSRSFLKSLAQIKSLKQLSLQGTTLVVEPTPGFEPPMDGDHELAFPIAGYLVEELRQQLADCVVLDDPWEMSR